MSNTNTAVETAPAVEELPRFLLHTRDKNDRETVKESFNLDKIGKPVYISGLGADAQMAMVKAAAKNMKVVSTGIPIDIGSALGEVTILRAWDVEKADGTRSKGAKPPVDYYVGQIKNKEAYDRLKANADFELAFSSEEEDVEEDGSEGDF